MPEASTPPEDILLKSAILEGLRAAGELQTRYRGALEKQLVAACDHHDGQSREKALEIASQVLADCFVKSPSLLESWRGEENLGAFLRRVGLNRLKTFWASAEKKRLEVNSEARALTEGNAGEDEASSPEEMELAATALREGVQAAVARCPDGLVFLRLKGLRGIDQRVIARAWDRHESHVSRRVKEAMEMIRGTAAEVATRHGEAPGSADFLRAVQLNPGIFFGSGQENDSEIDATLSDQLRKLAAGALEEKTRVALTGILAANHRALDIFASYLRREQDPAEVVLRDPALEGSGARLLQSIRATLANLQPDAAGNFLTAPARYLWEDTLRTIGAEGGSFWLLHPREPVLVAVHNPLEPEFAGTRQPLVSGIISLVLATGEDAFVASVASDPRHSPAVDVARGKVTRSLLAVPVTVAGKTLGVLTAVRFSGSTPFSGQDFATFKSRAKIWQSLLGQILVNSILELDLESPDDAR